MTSLVLSLFLSVLCAGGPARAETATSTFALIVGVNHSPDSSQTLHYADDDAAKYAEMFGSFGITSRVLTRADASTQRLHSGVLKAAQPPRKADLKSAVEQLAALVAKARDRGDHTRFYFVYAGHGDVEDGRGRLGLEDAQLSGADLERSIQTIGADETHLVVDACYSYFLAFTRGGKGERRSLHGFATLGGMRGNKNVGLLLSTASAQESHEWSGFSAGVFSHEVRSGLTGAADANADGLISYKEIAAFVARANQPIARNRYAPEAFARPPRGAVEGENAVFLDLRPALDQHLVRKLQLDEVVSEHVAIEDGRGIRFADVHPGAKAYVTYARGPLTLLKVNDGSELVIPAEPSEATASGSPVWEPSATAARGRLDGVFSATFDLPFDQQNVTAFSMPSPPVAVRNTSVAPSWAWWTLAASAATAGAIGAWSAVSASQIESQTQTAVSQQDVDMQNGRLQKTQQVEAFAFGALALAGTTALVLWLLDRQGTEQEEP
ncbi:MAG: caspase family protein [Deltaproteobacteria bacterium]|nr:caspase family protein [Deltaproteobacteria bacterium]